MMLETFTMRPLPRSAMCRSAALGEEEGAGEIHVEHFEPIVVGHLEHGLVAGDPRVVDEDVEPPVRRDDLLDGAAAVRRFADVPLVDAHGRAVRPREGLAELA